MSARRGWDYKKVLGAVYQRFAPDKVREINRVLTHFAGREEELIATLEAKYSVHFNRDGTFMELVDPDDEDFSYETATEEEEEAEEADEGEYEFEEDDYDLPSDEELASEPDLDEDVAAQVDFSMKSSRHKQQALAAQAVAALQLKRATKPKPRAVSGSSKRDLNAAAKRVSAGKRTSASRRESASKRASADKRGSADRGNAGKRGSADRGNADRGRASTSKRNLAAAAAAQGAARSPRGNTTHLVMMAATGGKARAGTDSARSRRGSTKASARGPDGKLYRKTGGLKANRGLGVVDVGISAREKAEHLSRPGTEVWVRDLDEAWVLGTVTASSGKSGTVSVRVSGSGRRGATITADPQDVEPVLTERKPLEDVQDLTRLRALHEPALLQALQDRFKRDRLYTFTGPILLAVNPYKTVDGLYSAKEAHKYMAASGGFTSAEGGGLRTVELAPHVYKLADDAYRAMRAKDGANQSILISGESGAGKTETTKIALTYLSFVSTAGRRKANQKAASDRVLRANPVLEAFGNAKTVRNDNSSRFGKLVQVMFDEHKGDMRGAYVETYLLEKGRVVHQSKGERNFHIFYELAAGASTEQKRRWQFPKSLKQCRYTGQSGTFTRSDIDDLAQFQTTVGGMEVLNFSASDIERVFKTVVAVLHLGNVDFSETTDSAGIPLVSVKDPRAAVDPAAELLDIKAGKLLEVLTTRRINVGRGETVVKSFDRAGAEDARDALAMNLYERVFGWVVWRTNLAIGMDDKQYDAMLARQEQQRKYAERRQRRRGSSGPSDEGGDDDDAGPGASAGGGKMRGPGGQGEIRASFNRAVAQALTASGIGGAIASAASGRLGKGKAKAHEWKAEHASVVGLLDIFGFESFEHNSFEQLCINYCNESLQQQFNEFVFQFEQHIYAAEGIDWTFVSFPDNSPCIALIEDKPMGVLSLLDQECMLPQGSDGGLLKHLQSSLSAKFPEHFSMTSHDRAAGAFTVRHFAGDVSYEVRGFCVKNKNELRQEAVDLVRSSKDRLISCLLPADADAAAGGADMAAHFEALMGADGGKGGLRGRADLAPDPLGGRGQGVGRLQRRTVGSHFRGQLSGAMGLIRSSEPHYIRCLKPNDKSRAGEFDRARMVAQLRYSGVLELVRVTRAGYPSRFTLPEFVERFSVLSFGLDRAAARKAQELAKRGSRREHVAVVKQICDNAGIKHGDDYQIGRTQMFLRQATLSFLEMKKAERTYDCVVTIQRAFRRFRGDFRKRYAAVVIQRNVRAFLVRKDVDAAFDQRAIAAEMIQTNPIFTRWLDGVMRRARRRNRKRAAQSKAWWKVPKWYEQNRELLFWALPVVGFYLLPTALGLVRAVLYQTPVVPILTFALFVGTFLAGLGITSVEELQRAMRQPPRRGAAARVQQQRRRQQQTKKQKPKAKPAKRVQRKDSGHSAVSPRSRVGKGSAPQRAREAARAEAAAGRKVSAHKAQVSQKFLKRADSLRQEKARNHRNSQSFEMPVVQVKATPKYRGLYLARK